MQTCTCGLYRFDPDAGVFSWWCKRHHTGQQFAVMFSHRPGIGGHHRQTLAQNQREWFKFIQDVLAGRKREREGAP